jgi:UDP-glucose 4-epimerase
VRALVTGGSGFIGRPLCAALAADGWQVHAVSRREPPAGGPGVRWVRVDLTDAPAVRGVLDAARPDVVVHLASRVTGSRAREDVVPIFSDTLASTVHVLDAASAAGVRRVVLAGSIEEPAPSSTAPPPSPYAAAKAGAAVYGRLFAALYGLEVVHLRIAMTYGPGQDDARKLVPSVIGDLAAGRPPSVSSGTRRADWVYIDDVVDACVRATTLDVAPQGPVDVGTGVLTSVRGVVERLVRFWGTDVQPRYGAVADRPLEVEPAADVQAAARALAGWRAAVDLDEGLRRTVAAARRAQGPAG